MNLKSSIDFFYVLLVIGWLSLIVQSTSSKGSAYFGGNLEDFDSIISDD